ncbi:hypothetical protein Q4503_11705 [Colwellia sp. 6_MG-2023]|nr:hypothetical protein [Colwellia sp. 6_MG-2023]MDO6488371.1 hypothetical protein [Colwellia sp. 6_MG-2023]
MSKKHLNESVGQRLLAISTSLSLIRVEQLHNRSSALYKRLINCCKNNQQRSTDPNFIVNH